MYLRRAFPERVTRCFRAVDTMDADALAEHFASEATLRLPGTSRIAGRAAIRTAFVQFSLEVEELRHEPVTLWTAGNLSVLDADVTFTLADQTVTTFPVTYSIRWAGDLIEEASVSIYLEARTAVALSVFQRAQVSTPVSAINNPATPAITPITGNIILRAMKNRELSTSAISSKPSPRS
jgi:ketosteroid isomerase-like protein